MGMILEELWLSQIMETFGHIEFNPPHLILIKSKRYKISTIPDFKCSLPPFAGLIFYTLSNFLIAIRIREKRGKCHEIKVPT